IMKKTNLVLILLGICLGLLQLIKPEEPKYVPVNNLAGLPEEVTSIIRNSCFNCHSTETNLAWYDKFTPANFFVYDHIRKGRDVLDFSKWDSLTTAQQNANLYYSLNKILEGEMPLASYTVIHRNAKLSKTEIQTLKEFIRTRTPRKPIDSSQIKKVNEQFSNFIRISSNFSKENVRPTANGIKYISDYKHWKVISI